MQQLTEEITQIQNTADQIDQMRLLVKAAKEKVEHYQQLAEKADKANHERDYQFWLRVVKHWQKIYDERKETFVQMLLKDSDYREGTWSQCAAS